MGYNLTLLAPLHPLSKRGFPVGSIPKSIAGRMLLKPVHPIVSSTAEAVSFHSTKANKEINN